MSYKKKTYTCLRCNHNFTNKSYFRNHLKRKYKCDIVNNDIEESKLNTNILLLKLNENTYDEYKQLLESKKFKCYLCNKSYVNKQNLLRHQKNCKSQNAQCEEIQLKAHENQQVTNIQNQTNIQNNIQNNNIHIHINGFDKEDLSKVDFEKLTFYEKEDFYKKSFQDKANNHIHNYLSILTDIISEPNNKNFKLLNKKDKKFLIKNNEDDSEITHLDVVKDHFYDVINDSYKDYVSDIKHYQRFLKLIDIEINEYEKGSKEFEATQYYKFIKKLKKYIKDKILWTAEDDKVSNKLSNS